MSIEDRATAYVLGALSPGERDEVSRERLYNRELDEHIHFAEQLFAGLQPDEAIARHPARDWSRVEHAMRRERTALEGKHVQECGDGAWQTHARLIEVKPLWSDEAVLIRCNPGAVEDAHDQPDDRDEHILVVAGDLDIGGRSFATGDYICVPAGSLHQRMETHGGCLLFTEYLAPGARNAAR
ncbi:cupin domain-containing protein [Novosphingobium sp. JCM 18896]|uniref:cupin domain-containing protein n=1 Tax=Novosphingobium sp. JCM 18896 TaxID=2989731 RepID=UPI00222338B5|nr:cupin domain-containing protein [Novosphingobium sp. JCM 18896]MCW1427817.1 cupin domain-containing protein [Novosphingobium sp. JCM 18896]